MTKAETTLLNAMQVFGNEFPRSQSSRRTILHMIPGSTREEWDPFTSLDDQFYEVCADEIFESKANEWLRVVCRIKDLKAGLVG